MKILLVDDDESLIDLLRISLGEQNYAIDTVKDGEEGWIYGSTYAYNLIILDWSLPKLDGLSLCQRFRTQGYDTPILLLSARDGSQNKIKGLDAGADDYLSKPFDIEELAARIRALLRRSSSNSSNAISWGDLHLDPCTGEVTYQGQLILLTPKEYSLLELFLRHPQEVFSIEEIIENLWSSVEFPAEATVRSHLRRLRNQLKLAGLPENPIETVRGRGYFLKNPPQTPNSTNRLTSEQHQESKHLQHLAALNSAWEKYQHKSNQHLETIKAALQALKNGNLSYSDRQSAILIAHSLAGNLGLFGFHTASQFAKELEELLQTANHHQNQQLLKSENILNTLCQELNISDNPSQKISSRLRKHHPLILVVDDDTKFTDQLTQEADIQGIQTAIATTPELARKWLDSKQNLEVPNAVILKVCFTKSAYQPRILLESLSLIAEFNLNIPSIPVIVIADSDRIQDRLQVARHGSYFYLKRPVTPTQIIPFCQEVLKRSSGGKKIMVIDDDVELLQALPSLLQPWKFQFTTLHDPQQFWEVLPTVDPNLLILDIEMPYIGGIELCKILRNHPYWRKLPVLFLSVHTDASIREQVFTSGADDFVNKPVVGRHLAARILNCLERRA
ncbi:MAG: response regulator [Cyanobacteria bacterium P01_A01_bin.45]